METLFDFDAIRALFASGFRMRFDAMHAVTGPYAHAILEGELGAPAGTVINGMPLPDFGGHHPDPNLAYAKDLYDLLMSPGAPDFGAASDGDGDRNLIIGRGLFVTPSDRLAILAANAHLAPGYARARGRRPLHADQRRRRPRRRQARHPLLRDADGLEVLRQSARRRPRHDLRRGERRHRLQPYAREGRPVGGAVLAQHAGRRAAARRPTSCASIGRPTAATITRATITTRSTSRPPTALMSALRAGVADAARANASARSKVEAADDFAYHDPVDGSRLGHQGVRIMFEDGSRIVYRLSGTGTAGATLRVYIERYEPPSGDLGRRRKAALADLIAALARTRRDREPHRARRAGRYHLKPRAASSAPRAWRRSPSRSAEPGPFLGQSMTGWES